MAEQRMVQYGDRELPLPEGLTLDETKEMMRRFFPELADPKVDTQKKGDKTVYVFSKKAGTKGADPDAAAIRQRLARLKDRSLDPRVQELLHLSQAEDPGAFVLAERLMRDHVAPDLPKEAKRVEVLERALADLPVAPGQATGSIL